MLSALQKEVLLKTVDRLLDAVWVLTGSAPFSLQGIRTDVHDIDIQTDEKGAYAVGRALSRFVVRPVAFSSTRTIRSHFGRFERDGVSVEAMGDIQKFVNCRWEEIVSLTPLIRTETLDGRIIPVPDLRYEAAAYRKMGRAAKADAVEVF